MNSFVLKTKSKRTNEKVFLRRKYSSRTSLLEKNWISKSHKIFKQLKYFSGCMEWEWEKVRAPFLLLLFLSFLISFYYYFHYFLFLIWFLANLSWAWSPIRVCLHHQGTVRSGNIRKLTSLAIFHTSKFLSVDLGLGFGRWHRRKRSSCFLSFLFWSTMDEQWWWYIRGGWVATVGNYFVLSC